VRIIAIEILLRASDVMAILSLTHKTLSNMLFSQKSDLLSTNLKATFNDTHLIYYLFRIAINVHEIFGVENEKSRKEE
jgi:hypothetical protein